MLMPHRQYESTMIITDTEVNFHIFLRKYIEFFRNLFSNYLHIEAEFVCLCGIGRRRLKKGFGCYIIGVGNGLDRSADSRRGLSLHKKPAFFQIFLTFTLGEILLWLRKEAGFMKIKEVIEKTGLTDRAIRLYIDEGLAAPSIEESYSGRKSIEFSESDVERLKNVALLRKAGFSIADIKSMVDNKETAKEVVEKFIEQTEINIAHETEIVEKLKSISFDEDVTIENICDSLSATVEEKQVPGEDMKLTLKEKAIKIVSVSFALLQLVFAVSAVVLICSILFDFRYIKLDISSSLPLVLYAGWFIVIILSAIVIRMNTDKQFQRRIKGVTPGLLIFSVMGNAFLSVVTFFLLFASAIPFYSQTTDPDNYLKLDRYLENYKKEDYPDYFLNSVFEVFPEKIPESARVEPWSSEYLDTTNYFYEFTVCSDGYYGTYDICAEWVLSADEYEKAKDELPGDFLLEQDLFRISQLENNTEAEEKYLLDSRVEHNNYKVIQKGDWTLVYQKNNVGYVNGNSDEASESEQRYEETGDEFDIESWGTERISYSFLICAYNDKQQKIRYIVSECCSHATRKDGPYYLSLEW